MSNFKIHGAINKEHQGRAIVYAHDNYFGKHEYGYEIVGPYSPGEVLTEDHFKQEWEIINKQD